MCVSKLWCNLINDPYFVSSDHLQFNQKRSSPELQSLLRGRDKSTSHPEFSYIRISKTRKTITEHLKVQFHWPPDPRLHLFSDPSKVKEYVWIQGHCNGVVCAETYMTSDPVDVCEELELNRLIICNPITRRFQVLPESGTDLTHWSIQRVATGFGFLDLVAYKVVRVILVQEKNPLHDPSWAEVYDSRSGSWKRVSVNPDIGSNVSKFGEGVYNPSDRCLYWSWTGGGRHHRCVSLFSFDLVDEEWHQIQCPNDHGIQLDDVFDDGSYSDSSDSSDCNNERDKGICVSVQMVGESVAMFVEDNAVSGVGEIRVWKMKREEEDKVSWTRMHNLKIEGGLLGFCRDGNHMLMQRSRKLTVRDQENMTDTCFGDLGYECRDGNHMLMQRSMELVVRDQENMTDTWFGYLGYECIDFNCVSDFVESLLLLNWESGIDDCDSGEDREHGHS